MNSLKDILINTGAIAGFAGIVGLAVLAMLYFSQARDVRRLREWAGREPERAAEVELRAQQIASQAIAQAYESMAMRQSEADAAAGIAHEQGVEVTAHAIAPEAAEGAEIVQPDEAAIDADQVEEVSGAQPETQQYDVLAAEAAGEAVAEQPVPGDADDEAPIDEEIEQEHAPEEQPAEVAAHGEPEITASENGQAGGDTVVHPPPTGDAPAEGEERPSLLAPSTPAAARASAPLPPLPPLDTSEFRAVNRPPTPQIPDYYLQTEQTGSGHFDAIEADDKRRSRVPFAVAGVLVAVFAVILIATQIGGGDPETPAKDTSAQSARDKKTTSTSPRNAEVNRPAVNVSVLNGTDTSGLAKVVGDQLIQAGFTSTTTGNRNDGTNHAQSTVYYKSGSKLEAEEVAKELKVKDIKEADEQTLAAGGSAPVIVVLGADIEQ